MKEILLTSIELKTFTEQNAEDYCQINNINPDNITVLDLFNNELTDISGIKLFKNLKELYLHYNKIKDISVIKHLKKLELLNIRELNLESNQIKYIQYLNNLEELWCSKGFKDMNITDKLNKNIEIYD